ncbi:Kinase-like protein [Mycena indigotica]|uniref:non-specific serine/threonine protein kinase n=1 Tax=Mycena indigotica TaxID=2126181 RepID=A0A8H6RZQ4_9AGAR|nr:Kinase-like protein [Mycena indigotica]KAF7289361.1 Kinase-like protein [Mycena indigotica]
MRKTGPHLTHTIIVHSTSISSRRHLTHHSYTPAKSVCTARRVMASTHYNPQLGATLKNERYTLLRKLGEGITAVSWLVRDSTATGSTKKYFAAKILSAEATAEPNGPAREREFLQSINDYADKVDDDEGLGYLPALFDSFNEGPHLCLILSLYSTSVSALRRSAPTKCLPVYMVRSIIYMTLHALGVLHNLEIVHTDVKLDNILFSNDRFFLDANLDKYLQQYPVQLSNPEPQPIPHSWTYDTSAFEAEKMTVSLIDYGHAEWSEGTPLGENFCPLSLRPPEVLLSSGFGTAIDIWSVGCLTFELLVGRWLFHPEDGGDDWTIEEDHLAKMQELTGQRFSADVLVRAKKGAEYFDSQGALVRIPELIPVSIEQAMQNYNISGLAEEDIKESADFIRACLQLDHTKRPTAGELLKHSFAMKAWNS